MLKFWSEKELRQDSARAVVHFISNRLSEPSKQYETVLLESITKVEKLFAASDNLNRLDGSFFEKNPHFVDTVRFLSGPPISQDDMKTLTGVKPPRSNIERSSADRVANVIKNSIDKYRFPWISENRCPTEEEYRIAVKWTAGVWAVELIRTWRRGESSRKQETIIAEILNNAGYKLIDHKGISNILPGDYDRLPRGSYTGELKLDGRKCDVPVRLRDGKLLAIECKVSNSEVNSIKRLVREVGGKADAWRNSFGAGIITVAVISGVFGISTLLEAQHSHKVYIVWEHNLDPLAKYLAT